MREIILARADAYIDAFTTFRVPADAKAEESLQTASQEIAAGSISGIRGQLDLIGKRTRKHLNDPVGHIDREIEKSRLSALKEGVLRLRRQRIKTKMAQTQLVPARGSKSEDVAGLAVFSPWDGREGMPTDFWDGLRQGFMQLRKDCAINPPLLPAGRLTAIWTSQPAPGDWELDCLNDKDGAGVTTRFEWHAQSAAARMGCTERGHAALSFWLDNVGRDAPVSHVRTIVTGDDALYSREILDICGLSADYCRKCVADEMRPRAPSRDRNGSDQQFGAELKSVDGPLTQKSLMQAIVGEHF